MRKSPNLAQSPAKCKLQGLDLFQGFVLLREFPILGQLILVDLVPLHQRVQCTARKSPFHNSRMDLYRDLVVAVFRMEVGWPVIIVDHV